MWVLVPSMVYLSESSGQLDKADTFFFFLLLNAVFIYENSGEQHSRRKGVMRKTPLWKIPTTPLLCRCLGPMDPLRSEERNMSVSKRAGRDPSTVSLKALQNWPRVLQDAGKHFTASLANSMKERYHVRPKIAKCRRRGQAPC